MRTLIAWTMILALGASAEAQGPGARKPAAATPAKPGQPATAPVDLAAERARIEAEAQNNRIELQRVLAEWEEKSKAITSLNVEFERIDRSPGWGDVYYQGRAMLQSPDLACLEFKKYKLDSKGKKLVVTKDGKPTGQLEAQPFERIVCTGKEVLQYSWDEKKIFVFPLDKQQRQKALQQGPLPFLFNMKAAELKQRYSMTLLKQTNPDYYLIGIAPNERIDKDSFSKAFLWLNKKTYLPHQLWLFPIGEKERQEFVFAGGSNTIVPNSTLDPKFFLANRFEGWKVIDNPAGDAPAPKSKAAAAPSQPARKTATQPATRPATRPQ